MNPKTFTQWAPSNDAVHWTKEYWAGSPLTREKVQLLRACLAGTAEEEFISRDWSLPAVVRPELYLAGACRPLASRELIEGAAAAFGVLHDSDLIHPSTTLFTIPTPEEAPYPPELGQVVDTPTGSAVSIEELGEDEVIVFLSPGCGIPDHVAGSPTTEWFASHGADLEQIVAAFEILLTDGAPPWNPAAAKQLAEGTGWPLPAAQVLLSGMPGLHSDDHTWMPKNIRELVGLTVAEAATGRSFLLSLDPRILAELLSAGVRDPLRAVREGLDVTAMTERWHHLHPSDVTFPEDVLKDAEQALPLGAGGVRTLVDEKVDLRWFSSWLWLAHRLRLESPLRPWLAGRLDDMLTNSRALEYQEDQTASTRTKVRSCLGLPEAKAAPRDVPVLVGPWSVTRLRDPHYLGDYDRIIFDPHLVEDWDLELDRARAMPKGFSEAEDIADLAAVAAGHFAPIQEWLRTPGDGWPQDPLASAPEILTDVQQTLDLSEDSARYWLQLLALHNPTDRHIHLWNDWTKTQRLEAATPLIEKGLVIEAKRPRAGRTLFLPGDWMQARSPHLPIEAWKAPLYDLENAPKVKPRWGVVIPTVPLPQLFTDAWGRYRDGDIPGREASAHER